MSTLRLGSIAEILYSQHLPHMSLHIIADSDGLIKGIVSSFIRTSEVSVSGIPHRIDILDRQMVLAAKTALQKCIIRYDSVQLQVVLRVRGGGPPTEQDIERMENAKFNEADPLTVSFLQNVFTKGVPAAVAYYLGLTAVPVLGIGIFCGTIIDCFKSTTNAAKRAELDARVKTLEQEINKGDAAVKTGYDDFVRYLEDFLAKPADRKAVVDGLYSEINAKKEQIANQPANPEHRFQLAVLLDCVNLVSRAIPDKKIAHQVQMVGEASLSFAQAFLKVKEMGGVAAAGLGLLGPVGLAISGIYCIYSLFSKTTDPDPIAEVADQIRKLADQTVQLEAKLNKRLDGVELLIADFQRQTFDQFKQLSQGITDLKKFSDQQFRSIDLKLDRISAYIATGLPAVAGMGLDALKFDAKTRVQMKNITPKQHIDLLIGFAAWAQVHSKNGLFTGALNTSYQPQDVQNILRTQTPDRLFYYLAHHPLCGGGFSPANPYVWSDAAEAYIQLRLNTPQFDATYDNNNLPSFLGIYNTGLELMRFITSLQLDRNLFQKLLTEYQNCLSQICNTTSPNPALEARLDAAYQSIVTFSEVAFQQSFKQDLIFSSFLRKQGNARLRLVDSQDVQAIFAQINQFPYEARRTHLRRELFTDLQRAAGFFQEVVLQKVDEARDSHTAITPMMQRLWDFGTKYFPNAPEFAPGTCPVMNTPHFTDTSRILQDDIFYAIFTSNYDALARLIAAKAHLNPDSLGRTALHYACLAGQKIMVARLVGAGANINAKDQGGDLPIFLVKGTKAEKDAICALLFRLGSEAPVDHWIPGEQEYQLGRKGMSRKETSEEAYRQFRIAAEKGHAAAQFQLGKNLTHTNASEGNKWILKAAQQGYNHAEYYIACRYMYGDGGFPKNKQEAINWFKKVAAQGHVEGSRYYLDKLLSE